MTNLFKRLFTKDEEIDFEKQNDQATLSFLNAQIDKALLAKLMSLGALTEDYQKMLIKMLNQSEHEPTDLFTEIYLLESYLQFIKDSRENSFYIKLSTKGLDEYAKFTKVPAFILFPLIQNAVYNGFNTIEKYPIRIRIEVQENFLKLEVSNRVNHHLVNQENNREIQWFKSRLEKLYGDDYTLLFNSNSSLFKATLFISLNTSQ